MKITGKEIFIILVLLSIAVVRFYFFLPVPPDYTSVVGKKVSLTGIVVEAPDERAYSTRLVVNPTGQKTNILVVASKESGVSYGDEVTASGVLETPENFMTTSGKEFNYERYLANQDVYYLVKNASVEIHSHDNASMIQAHLYKLRDLFIKNIGRSIAPPENYLADGLILGSRGGFDESMRTEFITTGTIHIIALSGYNVTIVAESTMKILGIFLSETIGIISGGIIIVIFILLAGASSTAIRAGIMAIIALFARLTGRTYDAGRALVVAAVLMIVYDARVVTDISFQLSFIATFGVLFITPKVVRWVQFLPLKFGLRELVATTIAATLAVLPILLHSTGILSLVSLPANILILPFIPVTMFMSFIVGLSGFISPVIAYPFAYLAHILLSYILSVIHFFASLSFASVTITSFPLLITLVLYGLIMWWVF